MGRGSPDVLGQKRHRSSNDDRLWGVLDMIDRRAIGSDLRYLSPSLSVSATLDYDIHFDEVNLALLNAS